ncbi:MAG TPA: FkbM family methyltransferase [Phototrophicaceae bacterium]|nr:FkbM family methyltransferase [Phototrophicaceae bacterium]
MKTSLKPLKRLYRRVRRTLNSTLTGEGVINFRGNGVINFIDIGSVGHLPSPWDQNAPKIHHLLKFEPRDQAVQSSNITTLDVALWSDNDTHDFYIYQGLSGSGSSLFRQNYDYVRENFATLSQRGDPKLAETWFERSQLIRTEKLVCRCLDDVLKELQPPVKYHFMKIDAQGAEYEILRGAEDLLRSSCIGLHLELFTVPLYVGIQLLPEVEAYLAGFGFELVRKMPAHGSFASQHDCLFLKTVFKTDMGAEMQVIRDVYKL